MADRSRLMARCAPASAQSLAAPVASGEGSASARAMLLSML